MKRVVLSIIFCIVIFLLPTVFALCLAAIYTAFVDNPLEVIVVGVLMDAATYTAASVHSIPLFTLSLVLIYIARYIIKPLVRR